MKFVLSATLLFALGVSAQTPDVSSVAPATHSSSSNSECAADFILTRCLETEQPKAVACGPTDYQCQCSAYEAIATCYNNCPDDPRAAPAQNQVIVFCQQVSLSKALSSATSGSEYATSTDSIATMATADITSEQEARASNTATFTSESPEETEETGAAPDFMRNTGGMLIGVAGVVAIML